MNATARYTASPGTCAPILQRATTRLVEEGGVAVAKEAEKAAEGAAEHHAARKSSPALTL
jgi:hypothetical protein